MLGNLCEPLVAFDADMRVVPALAVRWENPDDLTWIFHLRPDVLFHDGRAMEVADVVASLERSRRHPQSKTSGFLVAAAAIEATDPRTLTIRTAEPYPILLNKLTYLCIVPRDAPVHVEHPVGTGPYRLVEHLGGERLQLEAFEDYWGEPAPEPRAEYLFVADSQRRLELLLAGEVDAVNYLAPEQAVTVNDHPEARLETRSSLEVAYLQMSLAQPPFDDPRVREALDLALDRRRLVVDELRGYGETVAQMVGPNVFGFAPELRARPADPIRARQLLAEAGYPDGLDLVLEHREGRSPAGVVEQLAEVGVRVETVARPWSEMYPRLTSGLVPFYFGGWVCTSGDASDLFDQKIHTRDPERGYGAANSNDYSDPELDRLIEASGGTLNMVERRAMLQEAVTRLAASRAFLALYTSSDLYGLGRTVHFEPRQDGRFYAFSIRR